MSGRLCTDQMKQKLGSVILIEVKSVFLHCSFDMCFLYCRVLEIMYLHMVLK